MFTPKNMQMTDSQAVTDFLHQNAFAVMVSADLSATHLPLSYAEDEGEKGTFYGHIAKANPHWTSLDKQRVLLVFSGAHAYISPTWYVSSPNVSTWNYAAVHCYGTLTLLDEQATNDSLSRLIAQIEPQLLDNPTPTQLAYQQKLLNGIVGLKICVDDIQAKEKLGQHKSNADQQSVYQALKNSPRTTDNALASYMWQRQLGVGSDK